MERPDKILIIQPFPLGDVLRTTPLVAALKRYNPLTEIDFLVDESCADLLRGNDDIDNVIVIKRKLMKSLVLSGGDWRESFDELLYRPILEMRRKVYDWTVNLHFSEWSGYFSFLSRPSKRLSGVTLNETGRLSVMGEVPNKIYSSIYSGDRERRAANRTNLIDMTLELTEKANHPHDYFPMKWVVGEEEMGEALEYLSRFGHSLGEPLAVLQPGAGWHGKKWPAENYAALADRVIEEFGMRIFLNGAPIEQDLIAAVMERMKHPAIPATPSLRTNAAVISFATVFVSGDTGPMQIASALDVPVVALFGPTSFYESGPYGPANIILNTKRSCSPCFSPCSKQTCMKQIRPKHVLEAIRWSVDSELPLPNDEVEYYQTLFSSDFGVVPSPIFDTYLPPPGDDPFPLFNPRVYSA